jgi:hypothetical protein
MANLTIETLPETRVTKKELFLQIATYLITAVPHSNVQTVLQYHRADTVAHCISAVKNHLVATFPKLKSASGIFGPPGADVRYEQVIKYSMIPCINGAFVHMRDVQSKKRFSILNSFCRACRFDGADCVYYMNWEEKKTSDGDIILFSSEDQYWELDLSHAMDFIYFIRGLQRIGRTASSRTSLSTSTCIISFLADMQSSLQVIHPQPLPSPSPQLQLHMRT